MMSLGLYQYCIEIVIKKMNEERFHLVHSGISTTILSNENHLHDTTSDAGGILEDAQGKPMKVQSKELYKDNF